MENKYVNDTRYFENRVCKYYPCHEGIEHINCMFCYCPFYTFKDCPGNPKYKDKDGRVIKSCVNCRFPHEYDNIDRINRLLSEESYNHGEK